MFHRLPPYFVRTKLAISWNFIGQAQLSVLLENKWNKLRTQKRKPRVHHQRKAGIGIARGLQVHNKGRDI